MLARYQPDALRYFICAAGPETSDADFTWAEFVQRTNSELVAGWGNLVNRTATMIAKSFGEIPAAGALEPVDEAVLAPVRAGFDTVGDLIGRQRHAAAIAEAMRVVGEVNKYVTDTEPFKLKDEAERERLGTVLHVARPVRERLQHDARPFLPHSANAVHAASAARASSCPMPRIEDVADLDDDDAEAQLPGHHRRLHRDAALGVASRSGRRHGGQAHADLHQARPVGGRRGAGAARRRRPPGDGRMAMA